MGLLSGDGLSRIFGRAFSSIYEDGELVVIEKVRQPNGTMVSGITARYDVKVQLDVVTERMSRIAGAAVTDQRCLILRSGLGLDKIPTTCRLLARGDTWLLNEVSTDPARSYFEARASLDTST